jgi:two-component system chemotaxis response regulator CheB
MEDRELIEATCPECRGPLHLIEGDGLRQFQCLVGHIYSPRSLLKAHSDTQERALWAAVVALREAPKLVEAVGQDLPPAVVQRLREQAKQKERQSEVIEGVLKQLKPFQMDGYSLDEFDTP